MNHSKNPQFATLTQCLAAVGKDGTRLESVPAAFRTPEVCRAAVRQTPWALAHVPEEYKTESMCRDAVNVAVWVLAYVPEALRSPDLCAFAVQRDGRVLRYVPEAFRTPELCRAAVMDCGEALAFVPEALKTPELCRAAVRNDCLALESVPKGTLAPEVCRTYARIKIIGVGGGGINAINHMIASGLRGVLFIAADTDAQALACARTEHRIQLGVKCCRGLPTGGEPDAGRRAAEESLPEIRAAIGEAMLVCIVVGMGGGTGNGAAPIIASAAGDMGALTIGVATRPFSFERKRFAANAESGIRAFLEAGDSLVVIPGDRLEQPAPEQETFPKRMKTADEALCRAVRGITDIIVHTGLIALDFADIVAVMKGKGLAALGFGAASGASRARDAAMQALASPLLEEAPLARAGGLVITIAADERLRIDEVSDVTGLIQDAAHEDACIYFGTMCDDTLGDELRVTILSIGHAQVPEEGEAHNAANRAAFFADPVKK